MTRNEAQVILAAIRVLAHLQDRSPAPADIADLLQMSESMVRLKLTQLADAGAVTMVESAYQVHVEIKDHLVVEKFSVEDGPAISEDLAAFDRKKQEEADKMANLFDSGEHEVQRRKKLDLMDQDLQEFPKKPRNPFGDD